MKKLTSIEKTNAVFMSLLFCGLFAAMPAHAAGFGEIFTKLAENFKDAEAALKIICPILAFGCIIGAGFIFWKRSRPGGEQTKLTGALLLLVAGIIFAGASWVLLTAADSVGADITNF